MSVGQGEIDRPVVVRATVAGLAGGTAAVGFGMVAGWSYASAAGWTAAAGVFVVWTWRAIGGMNAEETATHATREDPARSLTDLIILLSSVASLAGVLSLLAAGANRGWAAEVLSAGLGITSVVAAWVVVHTVYTARYALLHYSDTPGGIDFDQPEPPDYLDFAYLAFTSA